MISCHWQSLLWPFCTSCLYIWVFIYRKIQMCIFHSPIPLFLGGGQKWNCFPLQPAFPFNITSYSPFYIRIQRSILLLDVGYSISVTDVTCPLLKGLYFAATLHVPWAPWCLCILVQIAVIIHISTVSLKESSWYKGMRISSVIVVTTLPPVRVELNFFPRNI